MTVSDSAPAAGRSGPGLAGAGSSAKAARAAAVRCVNTCFGVSRTPASRARATNWITVIESPPRPKKSSSTPTASNPSTCPNRPASVTAGSTAPGTGVGSGPGLAGAGSSARAARAAAVRCVNTCFGVSRTPASRARATNWITVIESPPRPKKSSSTPTASNPSTCPNRPASIAAGSTAPGTGVGPASTGPSGRSDRSGRSGAGRAERSTLPLGVSGSSVSGTKDEGTM
ncbi:hypothetical protein SGRIM128S_02973 [Streptomyces griseomycini]